jgi:hypothetical protein
VRNADCAILILIPCIGRRQSILRAAFSLGLTFQLSRPRGGAPKAGSSIKIRCRRIGIVFDAIFDLALGPLDEPKLRDVATVPAFEFLAAYLAGGAVLVPGHKHELGFARKTVPHRHVTVLIRLPRKNARRTMLLDFANEPGNTEHGSQGSRSVLGPWDPANKPFSASALAKPTGRQPNPRRLSCAPVVG